MAHADETYFALVREIMKNGSLRQNRTGVNTLSIFGYQMRFDLREGFPLLTTKTISYANIYHELTWFLRGETNVKTLKSPKIWEPWADENGELGRVYGAQWKSWRPRYPEDCDIDQIADLIHGLKTNKGSRRHIVTAWNPAELDQVALPPCHCFFQCNVDNGFLDLHMYQRSADVPIGVPYNIASYALLTVMLGQECNLVPRHFVHSFGDAHIYVNQIEGITEQLSRTPRSMPCVIHSRLSFADLIERDNPKDIKLFSYDPHPFIKMPVAV